MAFSASRRAGTSANALGLTGSAGEVSGAGLPGGEGRGADRERGRAASCWSGEEGVETELMAFPSVTVAMEVMLVTMVAMQRVIS